MRNFALSLFVLAAALLPAHAATVFKCTDKNGSLTYTNDATQGRQRGCRPLLSVEDSSDTSTAKNGKKSVYRRNDFPVVQRASQQSRDRDRLRILQNEWDQEKARLDAAEKLLNSAPNQQLSDAVRQHKNNLAALEKEMSKGR